MVPALARNNPVLTALSDSCWPLLHRDDGMNHQASRLAACIPTPRHIRETRSIDAIHLVNRCYGGSRSRPCHRLVLPSHFRYLRPCCDALLNRTRSAAPALSWLTARSGPRIPLAPEHAPALLAPGRASPNSHPASTTYPAHTV